MTTNAKFKNNRSERNMNYRRGTRSRSLNSLTVGIDVNQLEALLVCKIPSCSNDDELTRWSKTYCGLAERCRARGSRLDDHELNGIATILSGFLSSAPSLPSTIVARVHSFIGQIKSQLHLYDCAVQSFLKALWIETSDIDTPPLFIALTTHRLGLAYGKKGNYEQAIYLLEKALGYYEKEKVGEDKEIFENATESLRTFRREKCSKSPTQRLSMRITNEKKESRESTKRLSLRIVPDNFEFTEESTDPSGYSEESKHKNSVLQKVRTVK